MDLARDPDSPSPMPKKGEEQSPPKFKLEDSEHTLATLFLPHSPQTAEKPTETGTATRQQYSSNNAEALPVAAPAFPLTARIPKPKAPKKKRVPMKLQRISYDDMFKDTPRLAEEVSKSFLISVAFQGCFKDAD